MAGKDKRTQPSISQTMTNSPGGVMAGGDSPQSTSILQALKARAYDLMSMDQQIRTELNQVNLQIQQLLNGGLTPPSPRRTDGIKRRYIPPAEQSAKAGPKKTDGRKTAKQRAGRAGV